MALPRTDAATRVPVEGHLGTVLVVDGDERARYALVALLERAGFETFAAATGEEALAVVRSTRPWLVLLDVSLPDVSGYEVCRELHDDFGEELAVVFVSGDRTDAIDRTAGLLIGADDYVVEPYDTGELLARVRRLERRLRQGAGAGNGGGGGNGTGDRRREDGASAEAGASLLTRRELEVLRLLAFGSRARDIAETLRISEKTVSGHLQRILSKLGVNSRAQAVAHAYRNGLMARSDSRQEPDMSARR